MNIDSMRRAWRNLEEFVWPARAEDRSIPVLDGGLSPNDLIDTFEPHLENTDVDDVLAVDGWVVISDGARLRAFDPATGRCGAALDLGAEVGALATSEQRRFFALDGRGGVHDLELTPSGEIHRHGRHQTDVRCPTDATWRDGSLYVSEGSGAVPRTEWKRDLMSKGRTGRIVVISAAGDSRAVASGLAWAGGVAIDPSDPSSLLVTESWRHRVVRVSMSNGRCTPLGRPLAGYPGRITEVGDELLVTFLSLRTHLIEFVLREDGFRKDMIDTIHPDYWIAPALRITGERWEPLQIGSMKHLNVTKPWAPPRAYGLAARMKPDGTFVQSWQARVGSTRSGITGAAHAGSRLFLASTGGRTVLSTEVTFDV